MKTIIFAILMTGLLSACASAPKPKQPSDFNREPVNKTVPVEIQRGHYEQEATKTGQGRTAQKLL
ncbi:TPA: TrwH protein [Escherichia coli]|uniref:Conjugal transfer protein n=1 Tax=Providencia rettgeri TaxID=587 RepID=B2G2P5_PRORE|nr:conjugal transfer protein [Providencia rettgeri]HAZ7996810.1 TrwH protein [Escherichia coli]HAZ7997394.1 TrwH protein [Escherichia coli]